MARGEELIQIIAVIGFIAILGAGMILGLDAMETAAYDDVEVANETFNATSDPFNYTVAKASSDANFVDLESAQAYDTISQSSQLTTEIVNDTTVKVSGTVDLSDEESLEYTYNAEGDASSFIADSIKAFDVVPGLLEVIVVFGFVAVLIGLLWMAMGRMGLNFRRGGGL